MGAEDLLVSFAAGQRLGPYEIVALIGAGGMGEVYRARDARLQRDVAVKVLSAGGRDASQLRRFEQEARAAGLLSHPNVVAVYDVGSHDGAPYVVSELLEGHSLRERQAGAALPLKKALEYASQMAEGLAAAHAKGIVHRDLKPENVFITKDGRVKVLDFGLAKLLEPAEAKPAEKGLTLSATEPGSVLGTAGYMAPEQVRGEAADHRADIFAFGCVLFEMLTGVRAFQAGSAVETMTAILRDDPLERREARALSPALEHVLRRCLEKSPDERFQSARDLAFDLRALPALTGSGLLPLLQGPRLSGPGLRRMFAALLVALAVAASYYAGRGAAPQAAPELTQVTFRRGAVLQARFAPDAQTIVFSALWDGKPVEVFTTRPGVPEARPLGLGADLLAVSPGGELALSRGGYAWFGVGSGTLARASLAGGAPREVAERIQEADFGPEGELLVVSAAERRRIEYPIGQLLYTSSGWLSEPRVSRDGTRVAVLEHPVAADDRGSLIVVDRQGRVETVVSDWSSLQGLAFGPDGREIWFTGTEKGYARSLWAVRPGGRPRLLLRVAGPLTLHDVGRDGRALLSHSLDRFGIMARGPDDEREHDLSWLDRSIATDLSPDGRRVLFYESGEGAGDLYGVYVRDTNGSPAVRLGDGVSTMLSPDGRQALSIVFAQPPRLTMLPTGPGQPRTLPRGPIAFYQWAGFFPDGQRVLISGRAASKPARLWVQDLSGGSPQPITPEGTGTAFFNPLLPHGRSTAALTAGRRLLEFPLDGGEPTPLLQLDAEERLLRWDRDGRALLLARRLTVPVQVERLDLGSGRRETLRALVPADPAGVLTLASIHLAADEKSYAYTYGRLLSDLYVVSGLR